MKSQLDQIYNAITGDEDARVCKDIPDSACRHLPRNFFAYLCSNVLTKIADELASARLMLPWLLGSLGVPASFTGFLVPIREAGVLLPQLLVAAYIRRLPVRKWVWIIGAGLSALAMLLMALMVDRFHGVMAGWAVLVLITLFSLARGICSVSAKDVIGKTVSKTRRGVLMGYSAGISGVIVFCIGLYVMFYVDVSRQSDLFVVFLLACAIIWLLAILMFWLIREEPGAVEGGGNAIEMAIKSLALIKTDKLFREFLIARTLLLSVALVLPFYALMAQTNSEGISDLGMLIIAGGLAGSLSSPIWGKMGDQSSRRVMALSAIGAGILGIATFVLNLV
ncbi:MAG TPA: MFS transporter, partial [Gammaproteobacteria bacterium]